MADLLFEIGAEEIPAGFVGPALDQLQRDLAKALDDARLAHGEVKAVGTPRRLAVWARDVAARQSDATSEAFGPPVAQAFDAEGKPTPAALGFARSQGVDVSCVGRAQTPKGERLLVTKVVKGRRAEQVLPGILEKLLLGLRFKKSMRSRWDEVTFARPVRWLVALHGGKPVRVRFGEVTSGKTTSGHRFKAPKAIPLRGTPEDYVQKLRRAFVLVDPAERRAAVQKELARAGKAAGGKVLENPDLLDEVVNLVEHPSAVAGGFERSNLELPREVVISEMRTHQRYFAVVDGAGRLGNKFIAVAGTPVKDPKVSRHGYERVLRARLADARFFFEEDKKRKLAERVEALGRRTYQAKLGSELDRVNRIAEIAVAFARAAGKADLADDLREVARLAKTDLTTGMVGEFPELQGIMGAHYARLEGMRPEIADAIEDHYRPVGASGEMPRGDLGAFVGLADRLHQLVGIIGIGEKATGAADPFGLRRAAIGILRIVLARGYHLSLADAVEDTQKTLVGKIRQDVVPQVLDFLRGRLKALWSEEFPADLVEAVLSAGSADVVDARKRLEALAEVKARPDFVPLAVAFKRVANIQDKAGGAFAAPDVALFREDAEGRLHARVVEVKARVGADKQARNYVAALRGIAEIKPAVDEFFEKVLVMADDDAVRRNRLALMREISSLFADVADFRKIQADVPQQPRA